MTNPCCPAQSSCSCIPAAQQRTTPHTNLPQYHTASGTSATLTLHTTQWQFSKAPASPRATMVRPLILLSRPPTEAIQHTPARTSLTPRRLQPPHRHHPCALEHNPDHRAPRRHNESTESRRRTRRKHRNTIRPRLLRAAVRCQAAVQRVASAKLRGRGGGRGGRLARLSKRPDQTQRLGWK
jgi:hypothetical protein